MEQQIIAMLELQDGMNTKVHPDWRNQGYAWHRAIWVECAELMEHHGWKWWKKQSPDRDQVILELVDIWHFGLSILLLEGRPRTEIAATVAAAARTKATRVAITARPGRARRTTSTSWRSSTSSTARATVFATISIAPWKCATATWRTAEPRALPGVKKARVSV